MRDDDFRIFSHSSLAEVERTVKILTENGLYKSAPGQSVWLTHRSFGLHGRKSPDELDASWPSPLKAARDGMELEF